MNDDNNKIMTWHPAGRQGSYMFRDDYDNIKSFIISTLKRGELSISQLIDVGHKSVTEQLTCDLSWAIWVVKLDLEARGLIEAKSRLAPFPVQYLKLKHGAMKKIKAYYI